MGSALRDEYPVDPETVWSPFKLLLKSYERITPHPSDVRYELRGSSPHELRYEVSVPFDKKLGKLTKQIISVDKHEETSAEWNTKKPTASAQT